MTDITLFLRSQQGEISADFAFLGDDLATGHDLETAVLISLFSNRLAQRDYRPVDGNAQGWWADAYSEKPIGSRLWQFYRSKKTSTTRAAVIDAVQEGLKWMIDDGIASQVIVDAYFVTSGGLQINITIQRPNDADINLHYDWAWSNP